MSYWNDGPFTATAGATALAADVLVKPSGGLMVVNGVGDEPLGLNSDPVAASGMCSIIPLNGCVRKVTASKAISAFAAIYAAAAGRVSDAAVGKQIGVALEASTGSGGKIAALLWGTRGTSDVLTPDTNKSRFFDDFIGQFDSTATVGNYTLVKDGSPTIAPSTAADVPGVLSIATTGSDNDESYVAGTNRAYTPGTTKKIFFEARVKLTEANTDDANIYVGLASLGAANSLVDNGAGPAASYSGIGFFKVDGGTVWQFEVSNAGTQVITANAGAFVTATWYRLGFLFDFNDGTTATVTPYIDGVAGTPVALTIASLAAMSIVLGVKAGGGNAETLLVDYVVVECER